MSTAIATNPMGLKRICTECGARFYDLNNRPIICPSCETEFTGEVKIKSRRGRTSAADKKEEVMASETVTKEEEIIQEDDDGVEVVSLEDVEEKTSDLIEEDPVVKLKDEEELVDIPEIDEEIDDALVADDDTLLDEDE